METDALMRKKFNIIAFDQTTPRRQIGSMRLCGRVERANIEPSSSIADGRKISWAACHRINTLRQQILAPTRRSVQLILKTIALTQILPSVVVGHAIFMVNLVFRPSPEHIKESQAVGMIQSSVHLYLDLSFGIHRAGNRPRVGFATAPHAPIKLSGGWFIDQKSAQPLLCQHRPSMSEI